MFDNGAEIALIETLPPRAMPDGTIIPGERKWEVSDCNGLRHGLRRDREAARALAVSLPGRPTAAEPGAGPQ